MSDDTAAKGIVAAVVGAGISIAQGLNLAHAAPVAVTGPTSIGLAALGAVLVYLVSNRRTQVAAEISDVATEVHHHHYGQAAVTAAVDFAGEIAAYRAAGQEAASAAIPAPRHAAPDPTSAGHEAAVSAMQRIAVELA